MIYIFLLCISSSGFFCGCCSSSNTTSSSSSNVEGVDLLLGMAALAIAGLFGNQWKFKSHDTGVALPANAA
jgi:hypothetical protein